MQPRNLHCSGAQGVISLEGSSVACVLVEWVAQPAGCSITARAQEDEPVIWEALSVLPERKSKVGRLEQGEPELEPKQHRESEGRIRAMTSGNVLARGPERAKAARVGVSLRRAT
jgi:hypothetical protein